MEDMNCNGCIHLKLYAGSCTGECRIHQKDGWIGPDESACDKYWLASQICLTCKYWESLKFKNMTHWGTCQLTSLGNGAHKCDCYCSAWEEKPNLKKYLERIAKGEE